MAVATMVFLPMTARGQSETFGVGSAHNCIPFSCALPFTDISGYQQVFASDSFTGPILIHELDFFSEAGTTLATGTFSFFFSYTLAPVNGLSPTLDSNPSSVPVAFGTEVLAGGDAPATLHVPGLSFLYDPSVGSLLMYVKISGYSPSSGTSSPGFESVTTGPHCSRAFNAVFAGSVDDGGGGVTGCLRTEIQFTRITGAPEPTTSFMVATGLLALIGAKARRQRRG